MSHNFDTFSECAIFVLWCTIFFALRLWLVAGVFFLASEDFWRMIDHSFPACLKKKKKKIVEISSRTLIPLYMLRLY